MRSGDFAAGPGRGAAAGEDFGSNYSAESSKQPAAGHAVGGDNRLPVLAAEIAEAHAACRRSTTDAIAHAVEAGRRLIEAKQLVRHGQWVPWLTTNTTISVRTAQRYMAAADRAAENDTVSFFRLRDLARPIRERFGWIDQRRVLVLTPSTNVGFTHVTVIETETWDATGFLRPMRDDAIEMAIDAIYGAPMPVNWSSRKSQQHGTNPWLVGAKPVAGPEQTGMISEVIAAADAKLDAMGFTGPRSIFPEAGR